MTPGMPHPRSVAERWARGARALHNTDRSYALILTAILARSPVTPPLLPADPLEEALIFLFSGVAKEITGSPREEPGDG